MAGSGACGSVAERGCLPRHDTSDVPRIFRQRRGSQHASGLQLHVFNTYTRGAASHSMQLREKGRVCEIF